MDVSGKVLQNIENFAQTFAILQQQITTKTEVFLQLMAAMVFN